MVPPPLSSQALAVPRYPRASFSDAISSAASPLQDVFQLSCRSPRAPRPPAPRHVVLPRAHPRGEHGGPSSLSAFADQRIAKTPLNSRGGGPAVASDDEMTSTTGDSPTDPTWSLAPGTPALLRDADGGDRGKLGVFSAVNIIVGKTIGVGAFTLPPAVLADVGSVGMALLLWAVGAAVAFCGLAVYLELGTALPRSGGERVYLERLFRRPRMLASCMFMAYAVLLGSSAPNAVVLAEYALYALGGGRPGTTTTAAAAAAAAPPPPVWAVRALAVAAVSVLCYLHARFPALGLKAVNVLGLAKLLILAAVVVCGIAGGLLGVGGRPDAALLSSSSSSSSPTSISTTTTAAQRNFTDIWRGSSTRPYDYATALLKVVYCFRGYSAANQVLSDVRRPARTLRAAAPAALALVAVAYLAVNVAFFLVVDIDDIEGVVVVGAGAGAGADANAAFFRRLFGEALGARLLLPAAVLVVAAGNIAATAFAQARVNEELARDGLLPWSGFWTTPSPSEPPSLSSSSSGGPGKRPSPPGTAAVVVAAPVRGLLLHWAVSAAVVVLPPPGRVYHFLVDLGGYPVSAVSVAVSLGLLRLRRTSAAASSSSGRWTSPAPAPTAAVVVFAAANGLLLLLPWVPPAVAGQHGGGGDSAGAFAWYAYPATALAVLAAGALYWCWWRTRGRGRTGPVDEPWGPDERRRFLEEEEQEEEDDDEELEDEQKQPQFEATGDAGLEAESPVRFSNGPGRDG